MANPTVGERWERGLDHNPESERILTILMDADWQYGGDYFCWKHGGDGDNGETLMYMLDVFFDANKQPSATVGASEQRLAAGLQERAIAAEVETLRGLLVRILPHTGLPMRLRAEINQALAGPPEKKPAEAQK